MMIVVMTAMAIWAGVNLLLGASEFGPTLEFV